MKTEEKTVLVPESIMVGLYRIMCGLPYSMSGQEVYPAAIPNMQEAQRWVLEYGEANNIDSRGEPDSNESNPSQEWMEAFNLKVGNKQRCRDEHGPCQCDEEQIKKCTYN